MQNRAKRQKKEFDYLDMNIGHCCPQPKSKPHPKKLDIVAALREPSETRLAAHHYQENRRNNCPGLVIGTMIKTEIKSKIKVELERVNTRHKYKNTAMLTNVNYIHPDGTPCKCVRREADELPDLPSIDNISDGLQVETSDINKEKSNTLILTVPRPPNNNDSTEHSSKIQCDNGLPIETEHDIHNPSDNTSTNNGLNVETNVIPNTEKTDKYNWLLAETPEVITTDNKTNSVTENKTEKLHGSITTSRLLVETNMTKDMNETNQTDPTSEGSNTKSRLTIEMADNNNIVNATAEGLILLHEQQTLVMTPC